MRRRELMGLLGGASVVWPVAAGAQQPSPVIGWLSVGSPGSDSTVRLSPFRRGLNETGYVEGQNVAIEYRWAEGQNDRLAALAADLVRRQVAVIVAAAAPPAVAAKAATTTIPIVFVLGIDPVQFGLVGSLNRPGGNITGIAILSTELSSKRLDLLHQLLPTAPVVAVLVNPTNPRTEPETRSLQDAAHSLGLQLRILPASTASEIDAAFMTLVELRVGALAVPGDPFFTNRKDQILALAARHAVPAIYEWRDFVAAGGLMSYGPDLAESYRKAGVYTGEILNGVKPADLPVEQVAKVELVINLTTAKALGLTIPLTLSGRADEVIE
jgi:putative tryptophan/tyrosine transport system substrate-binding protein